VGIQRKAIFVQLRDWLTVFVLVVVVVVGAYMSVSFE
jgi:hypothetical protein